MSCISNGPFQRLAQLAEVDELVVIRCLLAPFAELASLTVGALTALTIDVTTLTAGVAKVDTLGMREVNVPAINMSPQNNLVIAGLSAAMVARFQLTGGPGTISLTGIDKPAPTLGGYSRLFVFFNRKSSSKSLTIEHENAGSMVANRFSNHGGVARVIAPGEARSYYYDEGDSRWIEVS